MSNSALPFVNHPLSYKGTVFGAYDYGARFMTRSPTSPKYVGTGRIRKVRILSATITEKRVIIPELSGLFQALEIGQA